MQVAQGRSFRRRRGSRWNIWQNFVKYRKGRISKPRAYIETYEGDLFSIRNWVSQTVCTPTQNTPAIMRVLRRVQSGIASPFSSLEFDKHRYDIIVCTCENTPLPLLRFRSVNHPPTTILTLFPPVPVLSQMKLSNGRTVIQDMPEIPWSLQNQMDPHQLFVRLVWNLKLLESLITQKISLFDTLSVIASGIGGSVRTLNIDKDCNAIIRSTLSGWV